MHSVNQLKKSRLILIYFVLSIIIKITSFFYRGNYIIMQIGFLIVNISFVTFSEYNRNVRRWNGKTGYVISIQLYFVIRRLYEILGNKGKKVRISYETTRNKVDGKFSSEISGDTRMKLKIEIKCNFSFPQGLCVAVLFCFCNGEVSSMTTERRPVSLLSG